MAIILVQRRATLWMLFGVKNRPFVSATFHRSRCGLGPEANAAAIGRPKKTYPDVEKIIKLSSQWILVIFLYLTANVYG